MKVGDLVRVKSPYKNPFFGNDIYLVAEIDNRGNLDHPAYIKVAEEPSQWLPKHWYEVING